MPADPAKLTPIAEALYPDAEITLLGCGGFACTFRIQDGKEDLALKIIDPEQSTDPIREEREVTALESVKHPNVVKYRSAGVFDNGGQQIRYLTMDFVDGKPLVEAFADGGTFTPEEVAALIEGIAEGAEAIWEAGLAHRDLSPGNVMVLDDGKPVIVDLGIARHLNLPTITKLPTPGTPGWMSPEQVKDSPERGDGQSDQFVIGLLIYRIASGVLPFAAQTPAQLWIAPLDPKLLPMNLLRRELPYSVGRLVERLTQVDPLNRYLAPDEFVGDAKRAAADLRSGVGPDPWPKPKFGLILGDSKTWLDDKFLSSLKPDGFGIQSRNVLPKDTAGWIKKGNSAAQFTFIDPDSYQDQSEKAHRHSKYRKLPYGASALRITKPFPDDAARKKYAEPIIDYQLKAGVSRIIAPYFHAGSDWAVDESVRMHRIAEDIVASRIPKKKDRPRVWAGLAVNEQWVRAPKLKDLLSTIAQFKPGTVYLVLETSQKPAQPLSDPDTLAGLKSFIETLNSLDIRVVLGKRYSSGLLFCALGAVAWVTGCDGPQQNGPKPRSGDEKNGGKGSDWVYVPELFNSLKIETRSTLYDKHPQLLAPSTPYAMKLFAKNPKRTALDKAGRILLHQHNIYAMRMQAAQLAKLTGGNRINWMRSEIGQAQGHYAGLGSSLVAAEKGDFLGEWMKLL